MSEPWPEIIGLVNWPAVAVLFPLAGAAMAFIVPRRAAVLSAVVTAATAAAAAAMISQMAPGEVREQQLGGWTAPLGITWKVDGLTVTMIAMTALVGLGVTLHVCLGQRRQLAAGDRGQAGIDAFWPLWLLLLAGLNALYLSADLFNLYVTLELVGLAAVGLTALPGKPEALAAAMRYLFVSLLASLLYLLGVTLIYAQYGALDIAVLRNALRDDPASQLAFAVMFAGLALKSALFPLHFWLPPAHGNAAPPVSAILSALVVKASLYIMLRLWIELFEPADIAREATGILLGALGAGAVLWGSLQALRAERMKLLVAYSTVAQVGYVFLFFPLARAAPEAALGGAVYLLLAHAFAKAALFLTCEQVYRSLGHDEVRRFPTSPALPRLTQITIVLAGVSLVGFPPSGGFVGKWLLLSASLESGLSPWTGVLLVGTLLSGAAMLRLIGSFFVLHPDNHGAKAGDLSATAQRTSQIVPLVLAAIAILLGLGAAIPLSLIAPVGALP